MFTQLVTTILNRFYSPSRDAFYFLLKKSVMDDWCFGFFIAAFTFFSISLEAFFLSNSFFLSSGKSFTFSSGSSILSSSEQVSLSYSFRVTKTEEKYPEIHFYMQINQCINTKPWCMASKVFFSKMIKKVLRKCY